MKPTISPFLLTGPALDPSVVLSISAGTSTANRSVPIPFLPVDFVTTISLETVAASGATVTLATSSVPQRNVVELTWSFGTTTPPRAKSTLDP